jgi:hypothetical protein
MYIKWCEYRSEYFKPAKSDFFRNGTLFYFPRKFKGPANYVNSKDKMVVLVTGIEIRFDPFGGKLEDNLLQPRDVKAMLNAKNGDTIDAKNPCYVFYKPHVEEIPFIQAFDKDTEDHVKSVIEKRPDKDKLSHPFKPLCRLKENKDKKTTTDGKEYPPQLLVKVTLPTKLIKKDNDLIREFVCNDAYLSETKFLCIDENGKEITFNEFRAPLIREKKDDEKGSKGNTLKSQSNKDSSKDTNPPRPYYTFDMYYEVPTTQGNDLPEANRGITPAAKAIRLIRHGPHERQEVTPTQVAF